MTAIYLPGANGAGYADYGRQSVPDMILLIRNHAIVMRQQADAILAAKDADFRVESYLGVHVQRDRVILQEGIKS